MHKPVSRTNDEAVPSTSNGSHDMPQQEECGDHDEAYEIHLRSSKTFKNKAMEIVHEVRLTRDGGDIVCWTFMKNLVRMFEDVIREATRGMDT